MKDREYLESQGVNVAKSLELFGDMETYNETLKTFIEEITEKKKNLKKYKEISDMQNYAIYAHSIKSDAKYFGFETLAALALDHEMAGKENNMYYVSDNFDKFMDEIERVENICRSYMGLELIEVDDHISVDINKPTILVVDDSAVIKKFIQNIFKDKYQILEADDGADAINILERDDSDDTYKIEVILLDLNMPNVNGFEVLEYLKQHNLFEKIRVNVITGVGLEALLNKAKEYDIKNVILKPFNERDIRNAVEELDTI